MVSKNEALKMAIETFVRWEDTYKSDCTEVINACKEALERPSNMVAVPLDKLQDMQRRLKSLEQPSQEEKFCDANCVWTDHHPDCKLEQPAQEPLDSI